MLKELARPFPLIGQGEPGILASVGSPQFGDGLGLSGPVVELPAPPAVLVAEVDRRLSATVWPLADSTLAVGASSCRHVPLPFRSSGSISCGSVAASSTAASRSAAVGSA